MKMNRSALFVTLVPLIAISALIWGFWNLPYTPFRLAGLVLLAIGIPFLTIARFQLGDSFSVKPEAKALVSRGLYSKIRNPVYVFACFVLAGLFLYLERPALLFLLFPLIVLQVSRARAEARVLEEKFGEEYRAYRARTWF
jgi:protein-S-isoprenylcysteine O-methyltransferase Ste14